MERKWFFLAITAVIVTAWMARFDVIAVGSSVHRLDRFTGTVDQCSVFWGGCVPLNKNL